MKNKRGSATIEAVIAFTSFLFVILTLLNVANYCRAQMLISNAVDNAARQFSQYSYFYKMSGLQKFNDYIGKNGTTGATNLNEVIDGVNVLCSSLSSASDTAVDVYNDAKDAISEQEINGTLIQADINRIQASAGVVGSSAKLAYSSVEQVAKNPLVYAKSIAAFAGSETLEFAKSRIVAEPIAWQLTINQFGSTTDEADEKLRTLGVVDGVDGLNFSMSTIFSPDDPDGIHLRCYYKLALSQFFDISLVEVPICKEAVCNAWLGGDDNGVVIKPENIGIETPEPAEPAEPSEPAEEPDVSGGDVSGGDVPEDVSGGDEQPEGDIPEIDDALLALLDTYGQPGIELLGKIEDYYRSGYDVYELIDVYQMASFYGINFDNLYLLDEHGLAIISDDVIYSMTEAISGSGMTNADKEMVLTTPKKSRPDPSEYLRPEYIENHLKKFENGGSVVMTWDSYVKFVLDDDVMGYPDGTQFVMPKDECNEIFEKYGDDCEKIAKALGIYLPAGSQLVRIDINDLSSYGLHIPSGNEDGANAYWIPGGYTSGGISEAVIGKVTVDELDPNISVQMIGGANDEK